MAEKPRVGDVWYRYYTKSYSEGVAILCDLYHVVKVCSSSVWLCRPGCEDLKDTWFLVGINCRSSRAKPTRAEAWHSYIIRTRKRVSILDNQLSIAKAGLTHAENNDMPAPGDGVWVAKSDDYSARFQHITERGTVCLVKPR